MELVKERPKEINGLFGVHKDNGTKQRLILDARRANLHFVTPGDPNLPHAGTITQLHNKDKKELVVGKIDIDNFYHRIALPDRLKTYFGLPKIRLGGQIFWPQMRSIPIGWSHSVVISQLIVEQILFKDANLPAEWEIKEGSSRTNMECRFGRYIDDIFMIGWNKK